jgi:hypothetical protein
MNTLNPVSKKSGAKQGVLKETESIAKASKQSENP